MSAAKTIDVEVCAALYLRLGTLKKVVEYLTSKGVINPRTNKAYTTVSIFEAIRNHPSYLARKGTQIGPEFLKLRKELGISPNK
jgi:hypothetical protein